MVLYYSHYEPLSSRVYSTLDSGNSILISYIMKDNKYAVCYSKSTASPG